MDKLTQLRLGDELNSYLEQEINKYREQNNESISKPNIILLKLKKIMEIEANEFS